MDDKKADGSKGKPAKLKRHRSITLKPHRLPDGTCAEPVITLDCEPLGRTEQIALRVEGADIGYLELEDA